MQLGIPFSMAEGINLGSGIDAKSLYIGLWDNHKLYFIDSGIDYYTDKKDYVEFFSKDITELMTEIRRVC